MNRLEKELTMRILRISGLVLVVLFLAAGTSYALTVKEAKESKKYFDKAQEYHTQERFDKAIAEYKKAIAIIPDYAQAHGNLGTVYYVSKGMTDKAIAEYKKAIAIKPNYTLAHHGLGRIYAHKGMFDEAVVEWKKCISIQKAADLEVTGIIIGREEKRAIVNAKDLKKRDVVEGAEILEIGGDYVKFKYKNEIFIKKVGFKKNDFAFSRKQFIELQQKKDIASLMIATSLVYGKQGKFKEAEKGLKSVLKIVPSFGIAKEVLKLIEDVLGKRVEGKFATQLFKAIIDNTIAEYKKAIAINPNYARAHYHFAVAYASKGMIDKAIAEHKKAIAINPNYAEAHLSLGTAYASKGMIDEAIAEYKKSIAINPNYAEAHLSLGNVYAFSKKPTPETLAKATVAWRRALRANPDYGLAHRNIAMTLYRIGEGGKAVKHCDRAIEAGAKVDPGFLEALKPHRK